jgi:hypothetical protein
MLALGSRKTCVRATPRLTWTTARPPVRYRRAHVHPDRAAIRTSRGCQAGPPTLVLRRRRQTDDAGIIVTASQSTDL